MEISAIYSCEVHFCRYLVFLILQLIWNQTEWSACTNVVIRVKSIKTCLFEAPWFEH